MGMETERVLFSSGTSLVVAIPYKWLKKNSLKKGDSLRLIVNDKILIELPKTEEELHKEIEQYEKSLRSKNKK